MTVIRNILKHLGYDIEIRRIGHTHSKPVLLELRSSKWFILATVTTATFTDIFLYGVIVPVIPYAITERAGIPADKIQYWTSVLLSVYGGALLAASQPWGWIADRWSDRRTPMLFGLFVLTVATAMMAVGSSLALLIVGRILQGLSGAIVWISSLALLCDTVGSKNIGQFMGYVGASLSVALLISPLLGGVVNVKGGYDAVFGMCWGCIGMDIVLRLLMIEKKVAAKYLGVERAWASTMALPRDEEAPQEPPVIPRIDTGSPLPWSAEMQSAYPGSPSPTERASTLVNSPSDFEKDFRLSSLQQPPAAAVTVIPNHNIAEKPLPIIPLAADAAVRPSPRRTPVLPSPSVSWHSRLSRAPLVILLRSPRMAAAMWGNLVQAILLTAFDATLPLHVRQLFGWSSLGAGLIFLPMTIPSLLGPLVGWWVDRNGARTPATLAYILTAPFLVLLRLIDRSTLAHKIGLCCILFGVGSALALSLAPIMTEMSNVVVEIEKERPGVFGDKGAMAQAYGLFNLSFATGCLLGPVWGGMLTERAGFGNMTLSLGLLSFLSAIPLSLFMGGPLWKRRPSSRGSAGRGRSRERRWSGNVSGVGGTGGCGNSGVYGGIGGARGGT